VNAIGAAELELTAAVLTRSLSPFLVSC
jgi:hypothetical protein